MGALCELEEPTRPFDPAVVDSSAIALVRDRPVPFRPAVGLLASALGAGDLSVAEVIERAATPLDPLFFTASAALVALDTATDASGSGRGLGAAALHHRVHGALHDVVLHLLEILRTHREARSRAAAVVVLAAVGERFGLVAPAFALRFREETHPLVRRQLRHALATLGPRCGFEASSWDQRDASSREPVLAEAS